MDSVAILAVVVVAPLAIIFHYLTKWKEMKTFSPEDEASLSDARRTAERLEDRLRNLERILDDEVPSWRTRHYD